LVLSENRNILKLFSATEWQFQEAADWDTTVLLPSTPAGQEETPDLQEFRWVEFFV
jgi:hypothetical protein